MALFASLAGVVSTTTSTAQAQSWPSRPIRLLTPIPPGGGPDIMARLLAPKLAEALGQPVLVENRVGGNGSLAGELVVKSAPDGYTLLFGMDSLVAINPHLYGKMPFDPLKDLYPLASLVSNGFFLALNPSVQAKTLAEFIDLAKRSQPLLQYASGGNGSQHHLTMERLKQRAGFDMVHIPYKGGAPATTATVAGEVAAMMSGTSTASQIRAGRLRAIAFTGPKRSAILPEVPAIAEVYPDFEMVQWYGVFAPNSLPDPVIARLRAEIYKALLLPDTREKLRGIGGVEPWITSQQEFAKIVREDHARYATLVKDVGAKVD